MSEKLRFRFSSTKCFNPFLWKLGSVMRSSSYTNLISWTKRKFQYYHKLAGYFSSWDVYERMKMTWFSGLVATCMEQKSKTTTVIYRDMQRSKPIHCKYRNAKSYLQSHCAQLFWKFCIFTKSNVYCRNFSRQMKNGTARSILLHCWSFTPLTLLNVKKSIHFTMSFSYATWKCINWYQMSKAVSG